MQLVGLELMTSTSTLLLQEEEMPFDLGLIGNLSYMFKIDSLNIWMRAIKIRVHLKTFFLLPIICLLNIVHAFTCSMLSGSWEWVSISVHIVVGCSKF